MFTLLFSSWNRWNGAQMYRVCSPGTLLALRGAALTSGGMGSVPKGALGHCPLLAPSCTHLMHTPMPPQSVQSCCQLGFFSGAYRNKRCTGRALPGAQSMKLTVQYFQYWQGKKQSMEKQIVYLSEVFLIVWNDVPYTSITSQVPCLQQYSRPAVHH